MRVTSKQDRIAAAPVTIDYVHHQVHDGLHFICSDYATGLATAKQWLIVTGTKYNHCILGWSNDKAGTWRFYETTSTGAPNNDGTPLLVVNSSRVSSTSSASTMSKDPTVSAAGTVILVDYQGGSKSSSKSYMDIEFILKLSTKYLIEFTPDGASTSAGVQVSWYEPA